MDGGSGRCLCGAVRYDFDGPPNWQAHCHCESCRRATSAPFTSFFAVDHARLRFTGIAPATYASSPGVARSFCPRCGSPVAYQSPARAQELDLYALTLEDPTQFAATVHVHFNEHLSWLHLSDGLPREWAPRRMAAEEDFGPVLSLIRAAFAFMEWRIDPPSSMHRLTTTALADHAREAEVWVAEETGQPVACMVLTPRADTLYLGKLAVADTHRGQGLGRQMVDHALARAKALGLPRVTLQTRVELTENHATFEAMGFRKTGATTHAGYDRPTSFTYTRDN